MARIRALRYSMGIPWSECLYMATYGYNVTEHSMLKVSPYALVFSKLKDIDGKDVIIANINDARKDASARAFKLRTQGIAKKNTSKSQQNLKLGDTVFVANLNAKKLEDRLLDIPFRIIDIMGKSQQKFKLKSPDNIVLVRSRKHI